MKRIKYEIRLGEPNRPMSTGHVHRPKEGRAHPLCGPLTERRPRLAHQVSENLLYKDETCSARMKLALQGKEVGPHYYKKASTSSQKGTHN